MHRREFLSASGGVSVTVAGIAGGVAGRTTAAPATSESQQAVQEEPVRADDLVSRWPLRSGFEDTAGDNDASVALGDPAFVSGERDALSLRGEDGLRVSRGGHGELSRTGRDTGPVSLSLWTYFDASSGGRPFGDSDRARHSIYRNDTGLRVIGHPGPNPGAVRIGASVSPFGGSAASGYAVPEDERPALTTETWHHLVIVVVPDSALRIFVDGERVFREESMDGYSAPNDEFWTDVTLGSLYGGDPERWGNLMDGRLSDVRVYGAELSASDVTQIYADTTTGPARFDDGDGVIQAPEILRLISAFNDPGSDVTAQEVLAAIGAYNEDGRWSSVRN